MEFKAPNKTHVNPFINYLGFSIEQSYTEKYPSMVVLTKVATNAKFLLGKKFVTLEFAIKAIDAFKAENSIDKGSTAAKLEMIEIGLDPDDSVENED